MIETPGSAASAHAVQAGSPARLPWSPGVLPGFAPTFGFTVLYLGLIVLLPLGALVLKTTDLSWTEFWSTVSSGRALAAYRISFGGALAAALLNGVFGSVVAWVLVRYRFPGGAVVDALVDLPLALPTAVAGIALTALYAPNGWLGQRFEGHNIKVAFTPLGVIIAMVFVGLPFVVRTLQPVLMDIDVAVEEAAAVSGASRLQTLTKIILPLVLPSVFTGFALAFARALGEYGSIVFISGNMPFKTEIVPLLIVTKLEQYQYAGATALAVVMLLGSFAMLFLVNGLQAWGRSRGRHG